MITRTVIALLLTFSAAVCWAFTACNPADSPIRADDSAATAEGVSALAAANNRFALELHKELAAQDESANLFFSPYSVFAAFGMVYDGARGRTAEEMEGIFGFDPDSAVRNPAFAAMYNGLNPVSGKFQLSTANALWVEKTFAILAEFQKNVERYFAGSAENVDFISAGEKARLTINQWVESKTQGKIQNLIPPGALTADTRLVITNAVYFKGEWTYKFDRGLTRNEEFFTPDGGSVLTPIMRLPGGRALYPYLEENGVQVVKMPYLGDRISMLAVLPPYGGLTALERDITPEIISGWLSRMTPQSVNLQFPKFTMTKNYSLKERLEGMGMPTAFSDQADFSGIHPSAPLFIQGVFHKAFLDVFEEGTEAAAATGVVVGITSVGEYPLFRADRPFLFFILDDQTGTIIFSGKLANPSA